MKRAFGVRTINGNECMYYSVCYDGINWRTSVRSSEKSHLLYDMCVALLSNDDIVDIKSTGIPVLHSDQETKNLDISPVAISVSEALTSGRIVVGAAYDAEGILVCTKYYNRGEKSEDDCSPSLQSNTVMEKILLNFAADEVFLLIFGELGRALTGLDIEDSKEIPLERLINGTPQNSLSYKVAQEMAREQ